MVIKEGWIMEEIVTRSKDFGTVLIIDVGGKRNDMFDFCVFF